MRWRIPLIAVLALIVAVSCDQQPVAPVQDGIEDNSALLAAVGSPALHFEEEFQWTGDLCGYDIIDCDVSEKVTVTPEWQDASGGWHGIWQRVARSTCVGQSTGYTWHWNEMNTRQSHWTDDFAPDEWLYVNFKGRLIGKGNIPNFRMGERGHYTVNANGDLVSDQYTGFWCINQGH